MVCTLYIVIPVSVIGRWLGVGQSMLCPWRRNNIFHRNSEVRITCEKSKMFLYNLNL